MRTILLEVSPLSNGIPLTLRMSGSASSSATTQLNGYEWKPCITKRHTRSATWAKDGILSPIDTSWGSIEFWLNKDFANDSWAAYEWSGALARIYTGQEGAAFSTYEQVFEGKVSSLDRTGNRASIALLGAEADLTIPLLSLTYGGTGGADGSPSIKGTYKPRAFGSCQSVAPVLVDGAKLIYQVHGYGSVTSIPRVYEFGQALDASKNKGDVADYAALAALTLVPSEWATCTAQGMFRLGGQPTQKVSADVIAGSTDVASIARQLLTIAGVPAAKIGTLSSFSDVNWNLFLTDQAEVLDTLRGLLFDAGGYIVADGTGKWQVGDYYAPQASIVINEDRTSFPLVKSIKELNANGPIFKASIGHSRCWNVHSESEVSPALSAISDAQIADREAVAAAVEAAEQAAADAQIAKERTDAAVADGILDRSEKAQLVQTFSAESSQQTGLQNQTTNANVTSERAALATAFANWKSYLEGLTPAYTDTSLDTPIDRATFNARQGAYWIAKQNLTNAYGGKASTVSTWAGVTGAGKPADNATVGAPAGTNVAGQEAAALVSDTANAKSNADTALNALKDSDGSIIAAKALKDADAAINANVTTARNEAAQASADAAKVRTDLVPTISQAQTDANTAKTEAATARTDLASEVTRAKNAEGAVETKVTNLKTTVDGHTTTISDNYTTLTNADVALANRSTALESTVNNATTGVAATYSRIGTEETTRSNADTALSNRSTALESTVNNPTTGVAATYSKISTEETTRSNADTALSNRATTLETSVNNGTTGNLALQGRISTEETTRSNADSALSTRATTLEAAATNTGNLVPNTAFLTLDGWQLTNNPRGGYFTINLAGAPYMVGGSENNMTLFQGAGAAGLQMECQSPKFALKAGSYYQVQALTASHRCSAWISLFFFNGADQFLGYAGENFGARINAGGQPIEAHDITGNKCVQAPAGTVYGRLMVRMYDVTADGYVWVTRPYVGEVKSNTDQWNAYSPGNDRTVIGQTISRISTEETTRADADTALSNRSTALESAVNNGTTGLAATYSKISTEETTRSNADTALANRSTSLESKVDGTAASGLKTLINNKRNNLALVDWWKQGASIPWGLNGGTRNEIVQFPHGPNFDGMPMPDGSSGDAWLCQGGADAAGGWNGGQNVPLDPDKTYRYSIAIAHLGPAGARNAYWGTDGICALNTTTPQGNPYFAIAGNMTPNRWHLFVGYIFPRNSTGKTHDGAGVWDMTTGEKIAAGTNYCFHPDGWQPSYRAYQYYAYSGSYSAFSRPMIELVDGSEQPLFAAFAATRTANSAQARITTEETTRSNADIALSNRVSTTESKLSLGTDSELYARIRTEETTRSNADSALATRSTALEANAVATSGTSLVKNNRFSMWSDGNELPNGWYWWTRTQTRLVSQRELSPGASGGYTVLSIVDANQEHGWMVAPINVRDGWFVMEAEIELLDGNLQGAGLTCSGVYNLDFAREPDVNGTISGGGFYRRRFSKLFQATTAVDNFHCMQGWSAFAPINYHYIRWFYAGVRPATAGEILAQKVNGDVGTLTSRIGTEETTRANAVSALANRSTVVESQMVNDAGNLVRNPTFNSAEWVHQRGGIPAYWGGWAQDNGAYIGTSDRRSNYGSQAPLQIDRNGNNNGISQNLGTQAAGWYVLEADITAEDGNWTGCGIHLQFNNGYYRNFHFGSEPDTNGGVVSGNIGSVNRKFSTMFYNGQVGTNVSFYLMAGWEGFATGQGFLRTIWHRVCVRPATDAEIKAQKVNDANLIARVTTTEQTLASAGNLAARWKISAQTPGANAFITAEAVTSNGVAVSNVSLGGTAVNLVNTDGSTARKALTVENGVVTVYGALRAGASITLGSGTGWPVALASKDFSVSNGEYVGFGTTLDSLPNLTFAGNGLVALNSGETYRLYAENLTRDGFTARLEISVPAQPSNYDLSSGQYSGSGLRIIDKYPRADSTSNAYNVTVTGYITATAYNNGDTYCIWTEAYTFTGKKGYELAEGDLLMVMEDDGSYAPAPIEEIAFNKEHCITLRSASGIELTVSRSTPVTLRDGTSIKATEVQGHELPVLDGDDFRWEEIVAVEDAGERPVARIYVGDKTFAAGNTKGRSIFTHNLPVNKN